MADAPDMSEGWCCDGRTWTEHAAEDGRCCQAPHTPLEELPDEGQRKALERLTEES